VSEIYQTGYKPAPINTALLAAVDRGAASLGTPRDGQTARFSRRLEKEVVPWSQQDLAAGRFGTVQAITNPDPVLELCAKSDESEWRNMERDPTVQMAKAKRQNRLLSFGSELSRPTRETPANKIIHEALLANLKSITKFGTVQRMVLNAPLWGWCPFEAVYESIGFKGRRIWVQRHIYEHMPEDFAFTIDRELLWHGGTFMASGETVFNKKADRFKWFTASSGSTSNPYGVGVYRSTWLPAYLLANFSELMATGVRRSIGIIEVTNNGLSASSADFQKGVSAPAAAQTAAEMVAELKETIRILDATGILGTTGGRMVKLFTDIKAVDAWMLPIDACKQEIELSITGQTLTSKIDGNGSRAAAETHLTILDSHCKADANEVLQPFVESLNAAFLELNFGEVDPSDISKWRSKIGSQVSLDAAEKLWNMGAALDGNRVAQDAGVPLAEGAEGEKVVLKKAEPQAMAGEQGRLPFGNSQEPTKDKPPAKKEARRA